MFVSKNPPTPNAMPHAPNARPNTSQWNIFCFGYVTAGVELVVLISSCLCNFPSGWVVKVNVVSGLSFLITFIVGFMLNHYTLIS